MHLTSICANAIVKFDRLLPKVELNGKKCNDGDLLSVVYPVLNKVFCASFCANDENCRSMFYKASDKSCEICSVDYANTDGLTDVAGTDYLGMLHFR